MSASFEELLDKSLDTVTMQPGSLLTGIIIDILETHAIVHVGLKSEAVVQIQEFTNEKGEIDLKKGDEVELLLEAIEDGHGNTRVSREKAIKKQVWKRIEESKLHSSDNIHEIFRLSGLFQLGEYQAEQKISAMSSHYFQCRGRYHLSLDLLESQSPSPNFQDDRPSNC